ncbi:McrB family protein [Haloimpatiens sp. FM7330]|uniref:McrB family protein n=1 Tax=Haloimpatiens sp. FM7330 TaxID=3298610 RepID=UPI003634999A
MNNNKNTLIIAYYLSKFDRTAVKNLGYSNFTEAFEDISKKINVKSSNIKNMRDEFDPIHNNNNRVGWHQREMSKSRVEIVDEYNKYSEQELRKIVLEIIDKGEKSNFKLGKNESDKLSTWLDVNEKNIIAKKLIDKSMFNNSVTIPKKYVDKFIKNMKKNNLEKGESEKIILLIDDKEFESVFRYVNVEKRDNIYQINFRKKIKNYFKFKLHKSYKYIFEYNEDPHIKRPEEYVEFYKTDKFNVFKLKFIADDDFEFDKKIRVDAAITSRFFAYIEPKGKFNGSKYQKSYKIVLLLALLKLSDKDGKAVYDDVCEDIKSMYLDRYKKGFQAEENVSDIQRKIENLSVSTVKRIMNENPYSFINQKGYIYKQQINEVEYLRFNDELWSEFTEDDKEDLKDILEDKLNLYYSNKNLGENKMTHKIVESNFNPKDTIKDIYKYITSKGYTYKEEVIKNFYLSLKTKPFVILYGISGTGKSKLVELFANAIGANREDGTYNLIPVRPDWSDPAELIGYKNINGDFQSGILTNIIRRAICEKDIPYFVCLDEMNLARVEYYFSDILSLMETRKICKDKIITDKLIKDELLGDKSSVKGELSKLYIPENLYIVGTVNMDETTFPFSKKVLDRANTIEFNDVDLDFDFDAFENGEDYSNKIYSNKLLRSKYLKLIQCKDKKNIAKKVIDNLKEINEILQKVDMHFGYRVRDEVIFYMIYAVDEGIMNFNEALDFAINQKILPRIQGNSIDIQKCLLDLFLFFSKIDKNELNIDYISDDTLNQMDKYLEDDKKKDINDKKVQFLKSSKKVLKMIRRFREDGFTTFW